MTAADRLAALALLLAAAAAPPAGRGREIYERGTSGGAEVRASMGGELAPVAASLVPCASCHGADGRGRPEGGVAPPDIRHATLTRTYDVTAPSGRRHGPYDERALLRAIAMGVDPAGNRLNEVMPRYQLSREDAAALLTYLRTLGEANDPGVSNDAISIGVVASAEAQGALTSWAAGLNAQGGIFGRRIELRMAGTADRLAALRGLGDTLAVIAETAGEDEVLDAEADRIGVPMLTILSPAPAGAAHRLVFDLFAGLPEQVRALVRGAGQGPLWIAGGAAPAVERAAREEAERDGIPLTTRMADAQSILFAGDPAALPALLKAAAATHPRLLVPAPSAGPMIFDDSNPLPSWVAFALLPSARSPQQQAALAAAALLADVLRRSGRDLSRSSLLGALTTTAQLRTPYAPPLSFDAGHRLGTAGAYLVSFNRGTPSEPRWIEP